MSANPVYEGKLGDEQKVPNRGEPTSNMGRHRVISLNTSTKGTVVPGICLGRVVSLSSTGVGEKLDDR